MIRSCQLFPAALQHNKNATGWCAGALLGLVHLACALIPLKQRNRPAKA